MSCAWWCTCKLAVRSPAQRSGKQRALGKIRCTIDPSIFPEARILPIKLRQSYWWAIYWGYWGRWSLRG